MHVLNKKLIPAKSTLLSEDFNMKADEVNAKFLESRKP
jgi:hypothetical protein